MDQHLDQLDQRLFKKNLTLEGEKHTCSYYKHSKIDTLVLITMINMWTNYL